MSTLQVFTCTMPNSTFLFGNGKPAIFVGGVYRTAIPSEIDYLDLEISSGHPFISRPKDIKDREVDSEMVDPMNVLRAKIIAEAVASGKLAWADPDKDMGSTDQNARLIPANSRDVAAAAAGGPGIGVTLPVTIKKA